MRAALSGQARLDRMRENIERFKVPQLRPKSIAICAFGPSLRDTWQDVTRNDAILTMSGAHDFLLERGVVPTYHVECDPREHKTEFLRRTHPDVTYFINSQCHPSMFEALAHRKVVMWHGFTDDDWDAQTELVARLTGMRCLGGGSIGATRSITVAREIGFHDFDCHAMDCCYTADADWAGHHYGQRHRKVRVKVAGREFLTSDLLMQATDDFFDVMRQMPDCRFRVNGGGLLEERMKLFLRDPEKALSDRWWSPVDFTLRKPFEWIGGYQLKWARESLEAA